jgi:L-ascorbate metabolism protein UlaG (beta-lactamase superfamily)
VYFAGDTDLFDEMAQMRGRVDVALLPIAGWGPSVGPGHLDPERAAEAARRIAPTLAIPIHWGTLALPWPAARGPADPERPAREFAERIKLVAPDVAMRVLAPGERLVP